MRPPSPNRAPDNLWFRLLIPAGFLFCATCLSWIMSSFGDPQAPANRWLNQNALWLILGQTGLITVLAITAMAVDRRRTQKFSRTLKKQTASPEPLSSGEAVAVSQSISSSEEPKASSDAVS